MEEHRGNWNQTEALSRDERERRLQELWKTKSGQQQVMNLFCTIFPDGVPFPSPDAIIDIILDHEKRS